MKEAIKDTLVDIYNNFRKLLDYDLLYESEKEQFNSVRINMSDVTAQRAIKNISKYLARQFDELPIILFDEYDTPFQAAWIEGYWDEAIVFLRNLFDLTFKTNDYFGRGLITGITRISKESIFSGMNNLKVVTATSNLYANYFGFTEKKFLMQWMNMD